MLNRNQVAAVIRWHKDSKPTGADRLLAKREHNKLLKELEPVLKDGVTAKNADEVVAMAITALKNGHRVEAHTLLLTARTLRRCS